MDEWQNLLSDMEASRCKYDKLNDRCRFEGANILRKNRFFLYVFVIIAMVYSCRNTEKLNEVLERLDGKPEESASIKPDDLYIEVSDHGYQLEK